MKFVELTIKKGFLERHVDFSEKANLIFSQNNSVGKTTLLRAALYAMGYPVPNTRGLKFEQMEFWLTVENQNQQFILYRRQVQMAQTNGRFCGAKRPQGASLWPRGAAERPCLSDL